MSVRITSTAHPVAIATYFWLAAVGFVTLIGAFKSKGLDGMIGPYGVATWSLILLGSGVSAGAAALISPRLRLPITMLAVEGSGAACCAVALLTYLVAIAETDAVLTETMVLGFATGCAARAVQVVGEHRKLRATLSDPE